MKTMMKRMETRRARLAGSLCAGALAWSWVLTGAAPALAQSPLERTAGITVEDEPVAEALRLLERTAGVSLAYSPDLIPPGARTACPCATLTVREALDRILSGTGLTYRTSGAGIRIVPDRSPADERRTGVVRGSVVDTDGAPVVNAMLRLDSGRGVLSDAAGFFLISDLAPGIYRLEVSSIGWRAQAVDSLVVLEDDTTTLSITLSRDVIPLPELLVAPGTFSMLEDVSPGATRSLTRDEIELMPQVGEDVFRAVKRLPGVASDDISTRLRVRGASDRELLVRLDGMELYEPYHLKDWDGALSIVDLHSIGGVELAGGGFGVEYGDKTAGVLDMTSRTQVGDSRTTLGFSVSNLTAMSRGGFDHGKGSWLLSARRGFMDWLMAMTDINDKLRPRYYDVFGKVSYQVGTQHLVSAHFLRAGDDFLYVDTPDEGIDEVDFSSGWNSTYAWVNWKAQGLGPVSASTSVWSGRVTRERHGFVEDLDVSPNLIEVDDERGFSFTGIRHELAAELSSRAMLKVGGEFNFVRADYAYANTTRRWALLPDEEVVAAFDTTRVDLEPEGHEASAFAALRLRPVERLTTEFGVRYDAVSHTDDGDLSPRVLASFEASESTTLRASYGHYFQSHGVHELEVGDGESTFYPSEKARQVAFGIAHRLPDGVSLRAEVYHRSTDRTRPMFVNLEQELQIFPEATGDRIRLLPDRGRSRGLEVMVDRRSGRQWAWSASYALAVAEDRVDGVWIPRRFDQRHTVGLHATYRPGARWNLTAGWRFHTGWPATSWGYDATRLEDGSVWWEQEYGPIRGDRLPAYHRLDLRVTRDFRVRRGTLQAFVDLFNIYNRPNLGSWDYSGTFRDGRVTVTRGNGQELLPFVPTFGFRYEF